MFDDSKRKFQLGLIYLFGALTTFGVAPFCILRYLNGEYLKAAVDLLIVIIAAANTLYAHRTKKVFYPSIFAAVQYSLATLAIIYINTPLYVFWIFPAFSANFFLLRAPYSVIVNLLIVIAMIPIALQVDDNIAGIGMIVSMMFAGSMTFVFAREADKHHRLLQAYATQDALTLLGNRRAMDLEMIHCLDDFKRNNFAASVIILDLDHFKKVNDNFGHKCGDEVLISIARLLQQRVRVTDRIFRFGGEEFVILARNTSLPDAEIMAEDLRKQIAQDVSTPEGKITASMGCAQLKSGETADQWFERADSALYRAKDEGRNRVVAAS